MKKKLLILLCSLLLSVSLVGCGKDSYQDNEDFVSEVNIAGRSFKYIPGNAKGWYRYAILVDKETRVQYLHEHEYHMGGLVVIVDAEGKPILYEGNLEVE